MRQAVLLTADVAFHGKIPFSGIDWPTTYTSLPLEATVEAAPRRTAPLAPLAFAYVEAAFRRAAFFCSVAQGRLYQPCGFLFRLSMSGAPSFAQRAWSRSAEFRLFETLRFFSGPKSPTSARPQKRPTQVRSALRKLRHPPSLHFPCNVAVSGGIRVFTQGMC